MTYFGIDSQNRADILFVDDEEFILSSYRRLLRNMADKWNCHYVTSAEAALEFTRSRAVDVVISDINMPGKSGFELLTELRTTQHTKHLPVVIVTGNNDEELKCKALDLGASDLLTKPVSLGNLLARVRNVLKLKSHQDEIKRQNQLLDVKVRARTQELENSRLDIIWRLAKTVERRDSNTGNHIFRVAHYCRILAERLGQSAQFCEQIFQTSPLHDIGKIGIPDSILAKPGKLSDEEFRIMQTHCNIGAEILRQDIIPPLSDKTEINMHISSDNPFLKMAADIAMYHHEHWDGRGYPTGSSGARIPLVARICAVADVYDALSSRRPYKDALPEVQVLSIMRGLKGTQFDPRVFDCFEENLYEFRQVSEQLCDSSKSMRER